VDNFILVRFRWSFIASQAIKRSYAAANGADGTNDDHRNVDGETNLPLMRWRRLTDRPEPM